LNNLFGNINNPQQQRQKIDGWIRQVEYRIHKDCRFVQTIHVTYFK